MEFDPWDGKIPGVGSGNPLQYFCLENPTEIGADCTEKSIGLQSQTQLHTHTHRNIEMAHLPNSQNKLTPNEAAEWK